MLCTTPEVCLAVSQSRGTRMIQQWGSLDSGQNCPWSNKDMFLDYGGDEEFDVKICVDASLTPIRIALSRDTGYVNGATI